MSEMARKLKERKAKASTASNVVSPVSPKIDNVDAPTPTQVIPASIIAKYLRFLFNQASVCLESVLSCFYSPDFTRYVMCYCYTF